MNADEQEQEDELLALRSIFDSEEFLRDESKFAGEIRVHVELPTGFNVALKEGEVLRQYEILFLPPLILTFELPVDYPSSSPPSFSLTCSWLSQTQLSALGAQLTDLYQASGGAVVLFSWVQFLKEDSLSFLDINSLLQLPSDEHSIQYDRQDSLNAAHSEPKNDEDALKSEPTDYQSCEVSGLCRPYISAPPLEVELPMPVLSNNQKPSDSQGASNDSYQISQSSGVREAEQTLQTSEFKADHQNDVSSAASTKRLEFAQSSKSGQEVFSNKANVSASLLLPSTSLDLLDPNDQGAASLPSHLRESPQNEARTHSGLSLTLSQVLLSQLLIYNEAQKRKAFATTVFDCRVCFVGWLGSDCVQLPECGHIFCQACLAEFCKLQITEGNVNGVTCPEANCSGTPTPAQVKRLVGEELFSRYDRLLLQSTLDRMGDVVYCPVRSCGLAVIVEKSSTAALCSACGFAFCVTCRKTYHGQDDCRAKRNTSVKEAQLANAELPQTKEGLISLWEDYASGSKQRRRLLESRYGRNTMRGNLEGWLSENWMVSNSKHCPRCSWRIQKNGGCNVMTCSQCGQQFCWICLTRLGNLTNRHFGDGLCPQYQF